MPDINFQKIILNLIPKKEDEPVIFYASQYETARPFIADLFWGESEFAPGDSSWAEIDIRKVDDNLVVITDDVTIDNNEVSVVLPVQALTCVGKNFGQVKIYAAEDTLVCALNFILEVQPDPLANGVTSETAIDNLTTQIDEIISGEGYVKDTDLDVLQSDWDEADPTSPAYIKNKPSSGTQVQVDWDEADVDSPAYIKHKPDMDDYAEKSWVTTNFASATYLYSNYYNKTAVDTALSAKADTSSLATVATSGDYNDLINKPYVPVYTENETPYQLRTSPAGNNRCLEKLVGCSVAFNQLVDMGDTSINTTSGHKYVTKINNVWSIIAGGSAVTIVDDSSDMVIDLTAMFGSEVADYLYNSDDGISIFRSLFGEDYYPYTVATLMSAKPTSKVIKDSNDQTITTYPLGGDELRGLLKVVDGKLVAFGDVKDSSGQITRVCDAYDFSSAAVAENNYFSTLTGFPCFEFSKISGSADYDNWSTKIEFFTVESSSYASGKSNYIFGDGSQTSYIYVAPSGTTLSQATDLIQSISAIYELATPTTASGTPFTNPQIVGSTEEFTDTRTIKMPCGHDSLYYNSPFKGW